MEEHNYGPYIVEKIGRVDARYYMIRVQGTKFLIDYSDPGKISNYLPPLLRGIKRNEWKLYKLAGQDIEVKVLAKTTNKIWQILTSLFLFIVFNGVLFPSPINLMFLTKDHRIMERWPEIIILIVLGAIGIGILLKRLGSQQDIKGAVTDSFILRKVEIPARSSYATLARNIIYNLFGYSSCLLLGICGANYVSLILFAFIGIYAIVFVRFLDLNLTGKYKIIEITGG